MIPIVSRPRLGATLIELLVTLTLLATIAAVTTLAARRIDQPRADDPYVLLDQNLRTSVTAARRSDVAFLIDGAPAFALIAPDGSVVADSALRIDRLTGVPNRAR